MGLLGVVLVAVISSAIVTIATTYVVNPVEETGDHVVSPFAQAIGLTNGNCPDGWKATARRDEHTRIEYCDRDDWRVYIHEDNTVSHACLILNGVCAGRFVMPEGDVLEVPGWPR